MSFDVSNYTFSSTLNQPIWLQCVAADFVPEEKQAIVTANIAGPLILEATILAQTAFKNRQMIKSGFLNLRKWAVDTFIPHRINMKTAPGEIRRIGRNATIAAIVATTISGALTAVFAVLAPVFSIPIAAFTIGALGKGAVHKKELAALVQKRKKAVVDAFKRRYHEQTMKLPGRIKRNIIIITVAGSAGAGALAASYGTLNPELNTTIVLIAAGTAAVAIKKWEDIRNGFRKLPGESKPLCAIRVSKNIALAGISATVATSIAYCIPSLSSQFDELFSGTTWPHMFASPTVISLEYMTPGLIHLTRALQKLSQLDISGVAYHAFNGYAGVWIAFNDYRNAASGEMPRLHHDFQGILLQILPFRPLQLIGAEYLIDSYLYNYVGDRGYDFSNIMMDYYKVILPALAVASLMQLTSDTMKQFRREAKEAALQVGREVQTPGAEHVIELDEVPKRTLAVHLEYPSLASAVGKTSLAFAAERMPLAAGAVRSSLAADVDGSTLNVELGNMRLDADLRRRDLSYTNMTSLV